MSVGTSGGSCYKALWAMHPPPKNILKEKTVQLSYTDEKNVNCHILAYFARHSGARGSIISHSVDLSLYVSIKKMMSFSGPTRFCPWNWLPDMRNSKDQKPNTDKRGIRLAEIGEIWARNILLSSIWYSNNNDHHHHHHNHYLKLVLHSL